MRKTHRLFDTKIPIIQAPMAGAQDSTLAIAVSNAGGLGSLPCAMLSPTELRNELKLIKQKTANPFNVNFFCHTMPKYDQIRELNWKKALAPYYEEYGIGSYEAHESTKRMPFNEESLDILEEYKPPVISFHFGLPPKYLLQRLKKLGSKIICSATTVDEALWLEKNGVNAIIAQGLEAGGHRGNFLSDDLSNQLGIFALLPQIVKAVKLPVIAAGGIANNQCASAAMKLGAAAVQVGTAYLLCPEARINRLHRDALKSPSAQHTVITNLFSGKPARGIMNRIKRELGPMADNIPSFPFAASAITPLKIKAESQGCSEFSSLWCGQNASGCKEIPAAELTLQLAEGI